MNSIGVNALCDKLGIRLPIIQAPTGSIAGPELAAAVSTAGGLGTLGLTWSSPRTVIEHIATVRETTLSPFGVNFVLRFDDLPINSALESGAPVVMFSWGINPELLRRARSFGVRIGIQAGSVEGALAAADQEPDFIICQGIEAGGHVQSTTTLAHLLAQVRDKNIGVPVVAAGGIATGQEIADAMLTGADGVMIGTRFVATRESRAHAIYKSRIVDSSREDTALTVCFEGDWPHAPHRVLRNRTLEMWESAGSPGPGSRPGEGDTIAHLPSGETILRYEDTAPRIGMTGSLEEMALYCGTGVGDITDIPSAQVLVKQLWADAVAAGVRT